MDSSDRFDTYLLETDAAATDDAQATEAAAEHPTDPDITGEEESPASNGDQTIAFDEPIDVIKGNGQDHDEQTADLDANPDGESETVDVISERPTDVVSDEPISVFRAASLSVADAIESAVQGTEQRHSTLQADFDRLSEQHAASDARQQQLTQSVASIQSWQSQSDGRLNQVDLKQRSITESQKAIGESVNSVLTNQKTSAKCYNDVMAALHAIQATQQLDQQRIDELVHQFDAKLTALRKTLVFGGVLIGALAVAGVVVGLL